MSAALNDTVPVWAVVVHTHKNLSMSKKSRSCFDRCSSAKGFMAPENKKHLLKLREGYSKHIYWTLAQISSCLWWGERKVYGKQDYGEIDYILTASKFFMESYPRILSSRNNLWENLHRQIHCNIGN